MPMYDAKKLRIAMLEQGLNPNRLAKKTGLTYRTVRKIILTGVANPAKVKQIAKALGIELKDIVLRNIA